MAAILVFRDKLTRVNTLGLCVVTLGVAAYNWHKYRKVSRRGAACNEQLCLQCTNCLACVALSCRCKLGGSMAMGPRMRSSSCCLLQAHTRQNPTSLLENPKLT